MSNPNHNPYDPAQGPQDGDQPYGDQTYGDPAHGGQPRGDQPLAGSQAITPTAMVTTRAAMAFPAMVAQTKQPAGTKNRAMADTSSTRATLAGKSTTPQ